MGILHHARDRHDWTLPWSVICLRGDTQCRVFFLCTTTPARGPRDRDVDWPVASRPRDVTMTGCVYAILRHHRGKGHLHHDALQLGARRRVCAEKSGRASETCAEFEFCANLREVRGFRAKKFRIRDAVARPSGRNVILFYCYFIIVMR